jgi:hypothetical protein
VSRDALSEWTQPGSRAWSPAVFVSIVTFGEYVLPSRPIREAGSKSQYMYHLRVIVGSLSRVS